MFGLLYKFGELIGGLLGVLFVLDVCLLLLVIGLILDCVKLLGGRLVVLKCRLLGLLICGGKIGWFVGL